MLCRNVRRPGVTKFRIDEMLYLEHAGNWVFLKRLYVAAGQRDVPYQEVLILNGVIAA